MQYEKIQRNAIWLHCVSVSVWGDGRIGLRGIRWSGPCQERHFPEGKYVIIILIKNLFWFLEKTNSVLQGVIKIILCTISDTLQLEGLKFYLFSDLFPFLSFYSGYEFLGIIMKYTILYIWHKNCWDL